MKKKTKKRVIIISAVALVLLLVVPFGISIYLYRSVFGTRYESFEPLMYSLDDFPGLGRVEYQFSSDQGQTLEGYLYYTENSVPKGIIVLAHGIGGGGHNAYMDCANYFAQNGYYVFGYDATGNDESEGRCVKGLPQGVIDLDYAITFLEGREEFAGLPIMLFGHSWGGYCVANVLNYHPEVKAVVSLSGFNRSADLLEAEGMNMVGGGVKLLMPYINTYEAILFGKYAANTAMSGFENSDAAVFIIHSEDDTVVPEKYGYDIYYEAYEGADNFTFRLYSDKGHNSVYYSYDAIDYIDSFNEAYAVWAAQQPEEITEAQWAEYIYENLDRDVWSNLIDEELFSEILAFYDLHAAQ